MRALYWWTGRTWRMTRRSVRMAMNFLLAATDHLLSVARKDLAAMQTWRNVVVGATPRI